MNVQCPRCLSSVFKKIIANGKILSCTHCVGWDVQKRAFSVELVTVQLSEPIASDTNVVNLFTARRR